MSCTDQSQMNFTVGLQYQGLLRLLFFSTVTMVPCCAFHFINGTLIFTLRSKPVFCETSRYILLFNLLFADTVLLALSQLTYILAASRITLTYPLCGFLIMLGSLTTVISPLTLVVMSLERYVAVCYPLRHATIITIRNTEMAIVVVWAFSSLNVVIQVLLVLNVSSENLQNLQMTDYCGKASMMFDSISDQYEKSFTYFLFLASGVTVSFSYISVIIAARSASTDKASARKAHNTLLLHLVQLGLSLSATIHNRLLDYISQNIDRIKIVRIHTVFYVCFIILPRCLSSLIYGVRDQTIRPVLLYNLCFQRKSSLCLSCPDKY